MRTVCSQTVELQRHMTHRGPGRRFPYANIVDGAAGNCLEFLISESDPIIFKSRRAGWLNVSGALTLKLSPHTHTFLMLILEQVNASADHMILWGQLVVQEQRRYAKSVCLPPRLFLLQPFFITWLLLAVRSRRRWLNFHFPPRDKFTPGVSISRQERGSKPCIIGRRRRRVLDAVKWFREDE